MTAPLVDPRDHAAIVHDTTVALRRALRLADPPAGEEPGVPGEGLVEIFARLADIIVDRLNAVPDKNLIAFLSLVGVTPQLPQPARAPVTFHLAPGATRAMVRAGTPVAAVPAEGEAVAPVYETVAELVLTATLPFAAYVREPWRDLYLDASSVTALAAAPLPVFEGLQPIPHELYFADALLALPQPKDVTVWLSPADAAHSWPSGLVWSRFDGVGWAKVQPTLSRVDNVGAWQVSFAALPAAVPTSVGGIEAAWLRAQLATPLPPSEPAGGDTSTATDIRQRGLSPDAAYADGMALDPTHAMAPFGDVVPRQQFSIASTPAFSKAGANVTIDVELDDARPPTPAAALELTWSYWNGSEHVALGTSSPASGADPQGSFAFVDGTQAFTRSGAVTFVAPADWDVYDVAGVPGHWLEINISEGDFGSPPAYAAPMLTRLTVDYAWPLPVIDNVGIDISIERHNLRPDAATFGATPLDLTKDFRPFGDKPRFNDTFYVAADEALSMPGARVTLRITGTKSVSAAGTPTLAWEVFDGADHTWHRVAPESDTTNVLTFTGGLSGVVVLRTPGVPAPFAVAGQEHYWLRARLVSGDYGKEAGFTSTINTTTGQTTITPYNATWDPPSIQSVTLDYDFTAPFHEPGDVATLNDFRVAYPGESFTPFTVTDDDRPTFYLGMDGPFAGDTTNLFLDVPDVAYSHGGQLAPDEPPTIVWEYWGPDGWKQLGTRDETRGFRTRGLLTFIAPSDMTQSVEFDRSAYWLRARWDRGDYVALPRLSRILTNTVWARHVRTVLDEVLGSSTGQKRQTMATAHAPVLLGQRIDVREPGPLSGPGLDVALAEVGEDAAAVVPAVSNGQGDIWVPWTEVVDFYGSGPRSRHYTLDHTTGEICFGDGLRGMVPPRGRSNVRAAFYETGGGAVGNRPAGSIVQLKSAIPYVDKVTNLEPADGGADVEALDTVRERGPRQLRHGNRAVAIADVEDLAKEASPGVARVLGVPATAASNAGKVGVVIVPKSSARLPVPSVELLAGVEDFLSSRLPPVVDLWVAGPGWMQITVTAQVVPYSLDDATGVQSAIRTALDAYLHPLWGGRDGAGWPFGRTPHRADLLSLIEGVPGVDHVEGLAVARTLTTPPPVPAALLPYSADHAISMSGSTESSQR